MAVLASPPPTPAELTASGCRTAMVAATAGRSIARHGAGTAATRLSGRPGPGIVGGTSTRVPRGRLSAAGHPLPPGERTWWSTDRRRRRRL